MGKLKLVLVAVVAVVAVALVGLFWLQGSIRGIVEEAGSQALGVRTTVQSADLHLLGGRLGLSQVAIANPEGFPSSNFIDMGKIETRFLNSSLLSSQVEVSLIKIDGVTVNLENNRGVFNYRKILETLRKNSPHDGGGSKGRQLVVARLEIHDISAKLTLGAGPVAAVASEPVVIPEIVLENLGSGGDNSVAMQQLVRTVVEAVMKAVVEKGRGRMTKERLSGLWGQLTGETRQSDSKPEIEDVVNDLQKLLKKP